MPQRVSTVWPCAYCQSSSLTGHSSSLRVPARSPSGRFALGRLKMRSGSCPQRHMPPLEPSLSARRAIFTSLPVVVALFLLPAIAFASPPDQLWIAGIYDGADGDDVVSLVYDTAAAHAADGSHITARPCLKELALESSAWGVASHRFARKPRAPPVPGSAIIARVLRCSPLSFNCFRYRSSRHPRVAQRISSPRLSKPRCPYIHAVVQHPFREGERPCRHDLLGGPSTWALFVLEVSRCDPSPYAESQGIAV